MSSRDACVAAGGAGAGDWLAARGGKFGMEEYTEIQQIAWKT